MRPALPLLFGLVLGLAACGGGSAGGGFAGGGTSGTGITRGPVSGFSSVIVSGQRYRIGPETRIFLNDDDNEPTELEADEALDVGLPVTVYWEERDASANFGDDGDAADPDDESDPTAEEIIYDPALIGQVTQASGFSDGIDSSDELRVLGVRVRVTPATLVTDGDGISVDIAGFVEDDTVVEVAGEPLSDGSVLALSIREIGLETEGYSGPYEVEGYVTQSTDDLVQPLSLGIGNLLIDYAGARGAQPFDEGELIVARAESIAKFTNGDPEEFNPDEIALKERGFDPPDDRDRKVVLNGYVSKVINLAQFVVAGQIVVLPPAQPGPPPEVSVGDLVRVEGTYKGESGRVVADDFDRVGPAEILIEDRLAFEVSEEGVLTTQLGIQLLTTSNTVFWDEDEDRLQPSDLMQGEALRIVAAPLGDGLYAVRVEKDDDGDGDRMCDITARVDAVFRDRNELVIFDELEVRWTGANDPDESVSALEPGVLVAIEARGAASCEADVPGDLAGSVIEADEITVLPEETYGEDDGEEDEDDEGDNEEEEEGDESEGGEEGDD